MKIIYDKHGIKIKKNNNNYLFEFTHYKYRNSYIKSLFDGLKIIKDEVSDNKKIRTVEIKAYSVELMSDLLKVKEKMMSYYHLKLLLLHGKKLLKSLTKDNIGVTHFNIDDFIIVNTEKTRKDSKFMFLNQDKFIELVNGNLEIDTVFNKKSMFLAPELLEIKSLPTTIPNKTSMFSLGLMLCHCLDSFDKKEFNTNDLKRLDNKEGKFSLMIKKHLESIVNSKLYWAMLRILEINPDERYLLWI